jgi:hypothetical protein
VGYSFACSPDLEHLLWDERVLILGCSEGVRTEPGIQAAGFVSAFAPLGWAYGATLRSPVPIARGALASLRQAGAFLCRHYGWPETDPFQELTVTDNPECERHHLGLMFSGGVDSAMALVDVARATPPAVDWLIHLTNFENLDAHTTEAQRLAALETTAGVADGWGLGWMHLWTNLASIYKHNRLDEKFPPECSFWLGLQHVQHLVTALTIVRPLLAGVSLAGGFDELLTRVGSCAASAAYVERNRFPAVLRLVHETERRQAKVERLLDEAPDLLRTLRVCYSSGDGTCADCRKCQATALMIVAAGGSLRATSFPAQIVSALRQRIAQIRQEPVEAHRFFNQALDGRALSGDRDQRWDQLVARLDAEEARASAGAST